MRPLSAIVLASVLAISLVAPASASSHRPRTAATYVADCGSADEEREETCVATFMSAIFENRTGPSSLCNPDVGDDGIYKQALQTATWLRTHPDSLRMEEFAGVRLAQWNLWACKSAKQATL